MSPAQGRTLAGCLLIAVTGFLAAHSLTGVAPQPETAAGFSAASALKVLTELAPVEKPHPVGSAENRAIRDRIVGRFRGLGYEVRTDRSFVCNAHASCATVENVIATNPAWSRATPAVLLVAHYDSVPAGPGAADDLTAVAIALEVARLVKGDSLRHPVAFLIDDGEEAGLLGAEAFLASGGLGGQRIAAVVNVEARGTAGPSFLFETGPDNNAYAPQIARALPRPATSSLFPAIYELLPNDTDLTIFKRAGLRGVNFAITRNAIHYHTPHDDRRHLDPRAVQHHGDNALAAVLAFAAGTGGERGNAVWFDLLGRAVLDWPARASLPIAIVTLFAAAAAVVASRDRRDAVLGAAAVILVAVLSVPAGYAAMRLCGRGTGWIVHPGPAIAAMWVAGITATLAAAAVLKNRATTAGVALVWSALAVVAALRLNGGSYLFIVPAVFLTVSALVAIRFEGASHAVTLASTAAAAVLWLPVAGMLHEMLGATGLPATAFMVAMVTTTMLPLRMAIPRGTVVVTAAALALSVLLARTLEPYNSYHRRKLNVVYCDDGSKAQWLVFEPSDEMRQVASFGEATVSISPWSTNPPRYQAAPAPDLPLPPVLIRREGHVIHVESQRGANRITVAIRGPVRPILVDGMRLPPRPARFRSSVAPGWTRVSVRGNRVSIDTGAADAVEIVATDVTYGLPSVGAALARARDASSAHPSDDGDVTMTIRRERL